MLRRLVVGAFLVATFVWIGAVIAAEMTPAPLNPAAINIQLPKDIKWKETEAGSATYVVAGDPNKPGFYAVLTKWHAGHSSRPHFHQNDRYIQVLSGTCWVGTGAKYDPDHTTPVPTGRFHSRRSEIGSRAENRSAHHTGTDCRRGPAKGSRAQSWPPKAVAPQAPPPCLLRLFLYLPIPV
jgi:hypothetical protein